MNNLYKCLLVIALLILTMSVLADGKNQSLDIYRTGNPQTEISEQKAVAIAQRHIQGRVLDIKRSEDIYRVKILSQQGSVHIVKISVMDGKIQTRH